MPSTSDPKENELLRRRLMILKRKEEKIKARVQKVDSGNTSSVLDDTDTSLQKSNCPQIPADVSDCNLNEVKPSKSSDQIETQDLFESPEFFDSAFEAIDECLHHSPTKTSEKVQKETNNPKSEKLSNLINNPKSDPLLKQNNSLPKSSPSSKQGTNDSQTETAVVDDLVIPSTQKTSKRKLAKIKSKSISKLSSSNLKPRSRSKFIDGLDLNSIIPENEDCSPQPESPRTPMGQVHPLPECPSSPNTPDGDWSLGAESGRRSLRLRGRKTLQQFAAGEPEVTRGKKRNYSDTGREVLGGKTTPKRKRTDSGMKALPLPERNQTDLVGKDGLKSSPKMNRTDAGGEEGLCVKELPKQERIWTDLVEEESLGVKALPLPASNPTVMVVESVGGKASPEQKKNISDSVGEECIGVKSLPNLKRILTDFIGKEGLAMRAFSLPEINQTLSVKKEGLVVKALCKPERNLTDIFGESLGNKTSPKLEGNQTDSVGEQGLGVKALPESVSRNDSDKEEGLDGKAAPKSEKRWSNSVGKLILDVEARPESERNRPDNGLHVSLTPVSKPTPAKSKMSNTSEPNDCASSIMDEIKKRKDESQVVLETQFLGPKQEHATETSETDGKALEGVRSEILSSNLPQHPTCSDEHQIPSDSTNNCITTSPPKSPPLISKSPHLPWFSSGSDNSPTPLSSGSVARKKLSAEISPFIRKRCKKPGTEILARTQNMNQSEPIKRRNRPVSVTTPLLFPDFNPEKHSTDSAGTEGTAGTAGTEGTADLDSVFKENWDFEEVDEPNKCSLTKPEKPDDDLVKQKEKFVSFFTDVRMENPFESDDVFDSDFEPGFEPGLKGFLLPPLTPLPSFPLLSPSSFGPENETLILRHSRSSCSSELSMNTVPNDAVSTNTIPNDAVSFVLSKVNSEGFVLDSPCVQEPTILKSKPVPNCAVSQTFELSKGNSEGFHLDSPCVQEPEILKSKPVPNCAVSQTFELSKGNSEGLLLDSLCVQEPEILKSKPVPNCAVSQTFEFLKGNSEAFLLDSSGFQEPEILISNPVKPIVDTKSKSGHIVNLEKCEFNLEWKTMWTRPLEGNVEQLVPCGNVLGLRCSSAVWISKLNEKAQDFVNVPFSSPEVCILNLHILPSHKNKESEYFAFIVLSSPSLRHYLSIWRIFSDSAGISVQKVIHHFPSDLPSNDFSEFHMAIDHPENECPNRVYLGANYSDGRFSLFRFSLDQITEDNSLTITILLPGHPEQNWQSLSLVSLKVVDRTESCLVGILSGSPWGVEDERKVYFVRIWDGNNGDVLLQCLHPLGDVTSTKKTSLSNPLMVQQNLNGAVFWMFMQNHECSGIASEFLVPKIVAQNLENGPSVCVLTFEEPLHAAFSKGSKVVDWFLNESHVALAYDCNVVCVWCIETGSVAAEYFCKSSDKSKTRICCIKEDRLCLFEVCGEKSWLSFWSMV